MKDCIPLKGLLEKMLIYLLRKHKPNITFYLDELSLNKKLDIYIQMSHKGLGQKK
jgi:hypothetical protein